MWREVEVVGVGDVASLFPALAFVWGCRKRRALTTEVGPPERDKTDRLLRD